MDRSSRRVSLLIVACFALQLTAASAATDVVCSPFVPHTIVVGDKLHDANCDAQTINDAITSAVCPNTTIYLTAEETYSGEHVKIQGKSLSIVGSTATACAAVTTGEANAPASVPTAPVTTISGNGSQSVFDISNNGSTGSTVTLQFVEVSGGNPGSGGYGGGIHFNGTGSLTLDTTTIDNNDAGYGAGIAINGNGGAATLTLKNYTLVLNNTAAHDGGGIRVEGDARLFMLEGASTISFNHADSGFGGGLEVLGPARADVASSGVVFAGAVSGNKAAHGGGVAVIATPAGDAVARVFTTDPTQPTVVSQNTASSSGGAFYLRPRGPYFGPIQRAELCAWEFRIDNNTAPAGAAIYNDLSPDDDSTWGDSVYFNPAANCGPETTVSLGAVSCAAGVPCNEVSHNAAVNAQDQVTGGSIIEFNQFDVLSLNRFAMRGSEASQLITANASSNSGQNSLSNCLIVDNHSAHELLQALTNDKIVDNCTFANNVIDDGYTFYVAGGFTLTHSIVDEPGHQTIDYGSGCCLDASYTLSNDIATFPPDAGFVSLLTDPLFVDATNANVDLRDYHLRAYAQGGNVVASPAIDFAPPVAGDDRDLDSKPHDQDVPLVSDYQGVRDLGCYEAQPIADRLFGDAFGDALSLVY